jgi:hypothetical protein
LLGLAGRGHRVTLLCNRRLVAEAARERGVETRLLRLGGDLAVHDAVRLALVLRRERPDVVIVGTFRKLWLAAAAATRELLCRTESGITQLKERRPPRASSSKARRWESYVCSTTETKRANHTNLASELVELTQAEWEVAIEFLTRTGQMCDDKRQEFIRKQWDGFLPTLYRRRCAILRG